MLTISFSGWGDRGFIDTFDSEDPSLTICVECAKALRGRTPQLSILDPFLNINHSHVCEAQGGVFVPDALPACEADPDQHGWRKVHVVRPECTCGPRRRVCYGVFDTQAEADDFALSLAVHGHATHISTQLVGNVATYYDSPAPPQ